MSNCDKCWQPLQGKPILLKVEFPHTRDFNVCQKCFDKNVCVVTALQGNVLTFMRPPIGESFTKP